MIKLDTKFLLFAALFPFSILLAQKEIPNNAAFATESINYALNELKMSEKLLPDKTYHVQKSKSDSLSAFVTYVVYEYLKERGYKAAVDGKGDNPETDLFMRIIEPMLNLDVKGGNRTLDGKFILLLYSIEAGKINWGEEYPVKFEGEDSVKGRSIKQLNKSSPGFLRIGNKSIFSGKTLEKVLAATVAGIITYLFYSVRG